MRFSHSALCGVVAVALALASSSSSSVVAGESVAEAASSIVAAGGVPFVGARTMVDGVVTEGDDVTLPTADVYACCAAEERCGPDEDDGACGAATRLRPARVGVLPQFDEAAALEALASAKRAWNGGSGEWPQSSLRERVAAVERFLSRLRETREDVVRVLMWEIGKSRGDAESEFDRTVAFAEQCVALIRGDPAVTSGVVFDDDFARVGDTSTRAFQRRAAIGVVLCLGPMNYPLNETYATLIPALLMGNVVVMKIPTVGGLAHALTMEAFAETLPKGAINLVSGGGRVTMPPLMRTGDVDALAFIGGSKAADDLIREHPQPHRLKVFLQLEAKNMGIILPDIFAVGNEHAREHAIKETVTGALSFNGQRCTALKIIFVPSANAADFARSLARGVEALRVGLPWQRWDDDDPKIQSQITPLPNRKRVAHMRRLIDDAVSKGAEILNENGGEVVGGDESTLMVPAVLFPVTPDMDVYEEEQFGPVVPVAVYEDLDRDVLERGTRGPYGQQVSVFTSGDGRGGDDVATVIDRFSSVFGKINVNSQCGRSPDTLPFSGRRSSAMGVMSVEDALREFSVPTVVAYKGENNAAERAVRDARRRSRFMESVV